RSSTPPDCRVLSPFGPDGVWPRGDYAIAGWAGRRAVDEHRSLASVLPGVRERYAARQGLINGFYVDPQPERLRRLAARWGVTYAVPPSRHAVHMPEPLAHVVFDSGEWSVLQIESGSTKPKDGATDG